MKETNPVHFNSKMVRLKVQQPMVVWELGQDFNSKMVRLKEKTFLDTAKFSKFQFQNGAIKSLNKGAVAFASKNISIPKWCD